MRKQTARLSLTLTVLPMTALAVLAMPHPPTGPSSAAHPQATSAAKPGSKSADVPTFEVVPADLATGTTSVGQVGIELVDASSQVQSQGQEIRSQHQQAALRARLVAEHSSPPHSAPAAAPISYSVPESMSAVLACIRKYESGDNYSDTSNPYYRGAYQFSWSTWRSVGGTGDPATAPPTEQDMRATMLAERSGWSAWSTASLCGV